MEQWIEGITVYAKKDYFNEGEVNYYSIVEFKKDGTTLKQRFEGSSFKDVIDQLQDFLNSLHPSRKEEV